MIIFVTTAAANSQLLPLPPVPVSPVNNAVNIPLTPILKWNIVIILGNLSSFRLQVSTNQNFNTTILDSSGITADSISIPQGLLTSNTQYYWRVNASILLNSIILTTPYSTTFRFTTGTFTGIEPVSAEVPEQYKLYNNFPNPFNPITKIKFDNIASQKVTLDVYDILGSKIEELVNEDLPAGQYEFEWNASAYSSGIYFYRVETGNFTDTKKMVITK